MFIIVFVKLNFLVFIFHKDLMKIHINVIITSISTLGLFQEIICNIGRWGGGEAERKNLGALNYWGDLI